MSSLSNPIYQHSGETQKICPLAAQASINEDIEQRRRQLDSQGEARKIILAKEVSNMIDETDIHLRTTPFPEAQESLTVKLSGAIEASKNILISAASATQHAADAAVQASSNAANAAVQASSNVANAAIGAATSVGANALSAAEGVAQTTATKAVQAEHAAANAFTRAAAYISHMGHDAASAISSATKTAAGVITNTASNAAHKAADLTEKAVDTTADLASAVGQKTRELAENAANKAHEVADNISHFTALVTLLAAEEKERARRLVEDETFAIINAMKLSEQIRALGPAFYRQETPNLLYGTKLLEEAERRWRLSSPYTALAANNAHTVGKLVADNVHTYHHFVPQRQLILGHIRSLEEKERTRRLIDSDETYAIMNALATRDIIRGLGWEFYRQDGAFDKFHKAYATTLLEEIERTYRIRTHKLLHTEDSAHLLMDVVATNITKFHVSTRQAAHLANEFAGKLGKTALEAASVFSQKAKDFAQFSTQRMQNAAGDISSFASIMYVLAREEGERVRRLNDPDEIYAIQNAWAQSALIRGLEGFWRQSQSARYPTAMLEELERRRRIAFDDKETKKTAHLCAQIVSENLAKFEKAHDYSAELIRKREVAAHSRLNPNAPAFVPHSAPAMKIEPPAPQPVYAASRATM